VKFKFKCIYVLVKDLVILRKI